LVIILIATKDDEASLCTATRILDRHALGPPTAYLERAGSRRSRLPEIRQMPSEFAARGSNCPTFREGGADHAFVKRHFREWTSLAAHLDVLQVAVPYTL
jgi:hypothetical protein